MNIEQSISDTVSDPWRRLILQIIFHRTGGEFGHDTLQYLPPDRDDAIAMKTIMENDDLTDRAVENYRQKLLTHELSDYEKSEATRLVTIWRGDYFAPQEGSQWADFRNTPDHPFHRESAQYKYMAYELDFLDLDLDEVCEAYKARCEAANHFIKEKMMEIPEIREAYEEEERKHQEREAEDKRQLEAKRKALKDRRDNKDEYEAKVKDIHPILVLVKVNPKNLVVTIGDGSYLERSVFSEAVAAVKRNRGKYNPKNKTWSIRV